MRSSLFTEQITTTAVLAAMWFVFVANDPQLALVAGLAQAAWGLGLACLPDERPTRIR